MDINERIKFLKRHENLIDRTAFKVLFATAWGEMDTAQISKRTGIALSSAQNSAVGLRNNGILLQRGDKWVWNDGDPDTLSQAIADRRAKQIPTRAALGGAK